MESEIKIAWLQGFVEAILTFSSHISEDFAWILARERWNEIHDNLCLPS
jgi:hypothetical protein